MPEELTPIQKEQMLMQTKLLRSFVNGLGDLLILASAYADWLERQAKPPPVNPVPPPPGPVPPEPAPGEVSLKPPVLILRDNLPLPNWPLTIYWTAENAERVELHLPDGFVVKERGGQPLPPVGDYSTTTPAEPGAYTYTIAAVGADNKVVRRPVMLTVSTEPPKPVPPVVELTPAQKDLASIQAHAQRKMDAATATPKEGPWSTADIDALPAGLHQGEGAIIEKVPTEGETDADDTKNISSR